MERCPCCMARLTGVVVCPRCQADLAGVLSSEQYAQHWLAHAVQFWSEHEPRLATLALAKSLSLKRTPAAVAFCDFITRQQVPEILTLLTHRRLSEAKQILQTLCELQPDHELLRQLRGFSASLPVE